MEKLMGVLAGLGLVVLILALMLGFVPWLVMLACGALGHVFGVESLFISFWQAVIVTIALSILGSFFRS